MEIKTVSNKPKRNKTKQIHHGKQNKAKHVNFTMKIQNEELIAKVKCNKINVSRNTEYVLPSPSVLRMTD